MAWRNTNLTYGTGSKTFHWIIALLIISLLAVGFIMINMPMQPGKFRLYGLHKSFGITVLTLVFLRLMWKLCNVTPALPETMRRLEKFAAHAGHWLLYGLMIAMPLSGWLMSSASALPVSFFGLFTLPNLIGVDKDAKALLRQTHEVLAWALIVMITLHVMAALLHHFYYKDNVLRRMLPFTKLKEENHAPDAKTALTS